jgi:hypothetical protein
VYGPAAAGLVTPSISTLTRSPAAIAFPLFRKHVIEVPTGVKQPPTTIPEVTSVTVRAPSDPNAVPDENVSVIWLFAAADNPPVGEVVKPSVYTVRAPAACDGVSIVTVWLLTDDAMATPTGPNRKISAPAATTAASSRGLALRTFRVKVIVPPITGRCVAVFRI